MYSGRELAPSSPSQGVLLFFQLQPFQLGGFQFLAAGGEGGHHPLEALGIAGIEPGVVELALEGGDLRRQGGEALEWGDDRIALAVCADFSHASHPRQAAEAGANIYAAGVLISEGGYAPDTTLLQGYAAEHHMVVLMANHGGPTGGWTCAGRSAIWGDDGGLIAAAPGVGDTLVIARRNTAGQWHGEQLAI